MVVLGITPELLVLLVSFSNLFQYIYIYMYTLRPRCGYHISTRRRRRIPKTNCSKTKSPRRRIPLEDEFRRQIPEAAFQPEDEFPPEDKFRRRMARRRIPTRRRIPPRRRIPKTNCSKTHLAGTHVCMYVCR